MENKVCKECGEIKPLQDFRISKRNAGGFSTSCKPCLCAYQKQYYQKNKDKKSEYYQKNIYKIKKQKKEFSQKNKDKIKEQNRISYLKKREERLEKQKEYSKKNIDKIKEYNKLYMRTYRKNKINSDEFYKIKCSIRDLIKRAMRDKNFTKKSKVANILGCSYCEFKVFIESKWEPWMNWGNYGNWDGISSEVNKSWDFDHIIPVRLAKTEEEFIELNHYTNFQPLCSYVNRYKKRGNL